MRVSDIMMRDFLTIRPDSHVIDAQRIMKGSDTGFLTVLDESNEIVGILTRQDIEDRVIRRGRGPRSTFVRDVMTSGIQRIPETASLEDAGSLMRANGIQHLGVTDSNEHLVGVVDLGTVDRYRPAA